MAFLPALLPTLGSFFGSASGIVSTASAVLTGATAISQGNYAAAVAKNNAAVAEDNANAASLTAQQDQMRSDREYAAAVGEEYAAQGASGLDVLGRTQLRTRDAQRRVGREAALDINNRGTAAARGLRQDAANFRAEGKQARTQGYLTAAGAALDLGQKATKGSGNGSGVSSSLVNSRKRSMPWNNKPNWYGRG